MGRPLDELLHTWLKGHADAIRLCASLIHLCHVWDDFADQDSPVSAEMLDRAVWDSLVEIPSNPFYLRYQTSITPVITTGILNWKSANRLERSDVYEHRVMAFTLRSMITDVIALSAYLLYGKAWAETVHYEMQLANEETLADYLSTIQEVC